jgi:hypothetical protein
MRSELQVAGIISSELRSGENLSCRSKRHWDTPTSGGTLSSFKRLAKTEEKKKGKKKLTYPEYTMLHGVGKQGISNCEVGHIMLRSVCCC